MKKRSEKYLDERWYRNGFKAFFAGMVAVTLTTGPSHSKTEECKDHEHRNSECLQNYYMCNLDTQECLKIFNDCRKSSNEPEKRCLKGT
jgi:hypothetical protein